MNQELGNKHSAMAILAAVSVFLFMGLLVFYADSPSPTGFSVNEESELYPVVEIMEFSPGETQFVGEDVVHIDEIGNGNVIVTVEKDSQYVTKGFRKGETVLIRSMQVKLLDTVWHTNGEKLALLQFTY